MISDSDKILKVAMSSRFIETQKEATQKLVEKTVQKIITDYNLFSIATVCKEDIALIAIDGITKEYALNTIYSKRREEKIRQRIQEKLEMSRLKKLNDIFNKPKS